MVIFTGTEKKKKKSISMKLLIEAIYLFDSKVVLSKVIKTH